LAAPEPTLWIESNERRCYLRRHSDFLIMAVNPKPADSDPPPVTAADVEWPLLAAAAGLLPAANSPERLHGTVGLIFVSRTVGANYADIEALALPGLRSLGAEARLAALPETTEQLHALARGRPLPIYGFAEEPWTAPCGPAENDGGALTELEAGDAPSITDLRSTVLSCGLLHEASASRVAWTDGREPAREGTLTELLARFTHAARISPGHRMTRRARTIAAAARAVVFALACPDRFLTAADADAEARATASAFFTDAAGSQRNPLSLRWRRAGELLAGNRLEEFLGVLYDAVLRSLAIPAAVRDALDSPDRASVTDIQRRELVYLARAGSRDLKALAVHRLSADVGNSTTHHTLEQLAYDPDPLVRAAAARALPAASRSARAAH
jgi:hypothetical protein